MRINYIINKLTRKTYSVWSSLEECLRMEERNKERVVSFMPFCMVLLWIIRKSGIVVNFYSFQFCIKWGSNRWIISHSIDILSVVSLRNDTRCVCDFTAVVRPIIFTYGGQWQWVLFVFSVDLHVVHLIACLCYRLCAKLNDWLDILICKHKGNKQQKNEIHTNKRPKRSVQERPRSKAFS